MRNVKQNLCKPNEILYLRSTSGLSPYESLIHLTHSMMSTLSSARKIEALLNKMLIQKTLVNMPPGLTSKQKRVTSPK